MRHRGSRYCIYYHACIIILAGVSSSDQTFVLAASVIVIVISLFRLIIELIQAGYSIITTLLEPSQRWFEYFFDFVNWLEIPLYLCSTIFAFAQFTGQCTCTKNGQWSAGILAVFLAWLSLVFNMRKLEVLGKFSN